MKPRLLNKLLDTSLVESHAPLMTGLTGQPEKTNNLTNFAHLACVVSHANHTPMEFFHVHIGNVKCITMAIVDQETVVTDQNVWPCCHMQLQKRIPLLFDNTLNNCWLLLVFNLDMVFFGDDAKDACAISPPPETHEFAQTDDAHADRHEWKFGKKLDQQNLVLPVQHTPQDHPQSPG